MKVEYNGGMISLFPNVDTRRIITDLGTVKCKFCCVVPVFREKKWYGVYNEHRATVFSTQLILNEYKHLIEFMKYCTRVSEKFVTEGETLEFFELDNDTLEEIRNLNPMIWDYDFIKNKLKTNPMEELIEKVIEWGRPKGLTEYKPMLKSWPQYEKTQEEVNEIGHAIAHGSRKKLIDGIGDSVVTLILLATQNGLTLQECVEHAYNEIKDRTGKTENGKFIKDGI